MQGIRRMAQDWRAGCKLPHAVEDVVQHDEDNQSDRGQTRDEQEGLALANLCAPQSENNQAQAECTEYGGWQQERHGVLDNGPDGRDEDLSGNEARQDDERPEHNPEGDSA